MREFPPFRLDTVNQCLWRRPESGEDERILLTPKAFAVLRFLVDHAGRLVTQKELLEAVWPDTFVQPEVLKYQIADIRGSLGDRAKSPRFIETVPRRGYRFIAAVQELESSQTAPAPVPGSLVGRDHELAILRDSLRRTLLGERQVVFITGEPGIGKTALVDQFVGQAIVREASLRAARGQCVEGFGGSEAYYPMLEALGELCRARDGDRVIEILAAHAPTWLVQFPAFLKPEHRELLQREILGATRDRMLREIREALDVMTSERPLLVVLEDLQWVDPSTVDLLSALARERTPAMMMLIITKREMEASDHPLKRLKEDLLLHHLCQEIAVAPLSEANVAEFLAAQCPAGALPEGFAALIHRRSEGNPLFMVAALDRMMQDRQISRESGAWQLKLPVEQIDVTVPETLRQMIEAQIDRLTIEEQRALEAASIAGASFSADVVAAVMKEDASQILELFERLSRRSRIIRVAGAQRLSDGRVSQVFDFVHALYREVFYLRQTPARKASLHWRMGEQLATLLSHRLREIAAELAHHFELSSDWARAIQYLRIAARSAAQRLAPQEAAANLRHALELASRLSDAERPVNEIGILEGVAEIFVTSGDIPAAETCYEDLCARADRYGLIDVEVRALTESAFIVAWVNLERGLELLERAFHLVATLDPGKHLPTRATCLFWRLWLVGWDPQHAEEYRNAIAEIQKLGDSHIAGLHLLDYSCIQWCSSEYRESYRNAVEGLKMLSEAGSADPFHSMKYLLAEHVPAWSLIFLGEWGRALREVDHAITMANNNGDYHFRVWPMQLTGAWLHLHACDFAGVLAICDATIPLVRDPTLRAAPETPPPTFRLSLILRGSAEAALGNDERAREYLFAARDDMNRRRTLHDWYWRMVLESYLTDLWLAAGELKAARVQAERFLSVTLKTAERTWQALAWEANARVALAENDLARTQDLIAQALSAMEGYEVPLAAWRVHATAAELFERAKNPALSEHHRELSRATILKIAASMAPEEPLRKTFLSAPRVREVLGDAERTMKA